MFAIAIFNTPKNILYACASLHANCCEDVMSLFKFFKRTWYPLSQLSSSSPTPLCYCCSCSLACKEQGCGHSGRTLSMPACKFNNGRDIDGDILPHLILTNQEE